MDGTYIAALQCHQIAGLERAIAECALPAGQSVEFVKDLVPEKSGSRLRSRIIVIWASKEKPVIGYVV